MGKNEKYDRFPFFKKKKVHYHWLFPFLQHIHDFECDTLAMKQKDRHQLALNLNILGVKMVLVYCVTIQITVKCKIQLKLMGMYLVFGPKTVFAR